MSNGMLGKLSLSAVRGPKDTLDELLAGPDGPQVLEQLKRFNRKQPCWTPPDSNKQSRISQSGLLIPGGYYSAVTLSQRHDPAEFYKTREGLYVGGHFQTNIVAVAEPTQAGKKFKKMNCFEITRSAAGNELLVERSQSVWEATDFCSWLAQKLSKQPHGESGEIANDNWTISLVKGVNGAVLVVYVYWDSVDRAWHVYAYDLSDRWDAGYQFISRN